MTEQQWDPAQAQWEQPAQAQAFSGPVTYGGWWARFGAILLDGLILGIPLGILAGVLLSDSIAIAYLLYVVAFVAYYALTMGRTGENNGQTLGKQVVGIRVVREDGRPVGAGWAILREIVKSFIGGITLYINFLWPLWDGKNQALHDKIMSDVVVKT